MLLEPQKDDLIDIIADIDFKYNGVHYDFTDKVMRADDDFPDETPLIIVSFISTKEKKGVVLGNFLGVRDNKYYTDYGYWDVEICVVRAFSRTMDGIDGRTLAQAWLIQIEKYIKINWHNLINNVSIERTSFPVPREMYKSTETDKVFGFETQFRIISSNQWTNEPEEEEYVVSPIEIEAIEVDDPKLRVTK